MMRHSVVIALLMLLPLLVSVSAFGQENELERGEQFQSGKDLFLAIKNYKTAFEEQQTCVAGRKLAMAYKDNKDWLKAEEVYRQISNMDGFSPEDDFDFGQLLIFNSKPGEAADHIKKFIQSDPENEFARTMLHFCQLLIGGEVSRECAGANATNLCVEIDARPSIDPGNPNLIYEWVIENEPPKTGFMIEHCFDEPGLYKARLNLIDITTGLKFNNDTILPIEIKDEGTFEVDGVKRAGFDLDFTASYKLQFSSKDYTFIWSYDDGSFGMGPAAKHTYRVSGGYQVQLFLISFNEKGVSESSCVYDNVVITTNIHDLY